MGDLRPSGVPVEINGRKFHFVFTMSAIEALESSLGISLTDIIKRLSEKESVYHTLTDVVTILINDEIAYNNYLTKGKEKLFTRQEVAWMISSPEVTDINLALVNAYIGAMPEPEEDDDPNPQTETDD